MLLAIVGQAGNVILFVLTGVAFVVVAIYTFGYAAHSYMVVAQGTAAGIDRVDWPDDPVYDWLPRSVLLVGLVLLCLTPAGIVARALRHDFLPGQGALRFLVLGGPVLWLLFPLVVLGSLSGSAKVIGGFARLFFSVVLFYLLTGVLMAAAASLAYVGIFTPGWYALPVAAVGGSAVLLIHARLLGRIGWLLGELDSKPSAPAKKGKTATKGRTKQARPAKPLRSKDPWAVPDEPEEEKPHEKPSGLGYRVIEQEVETRPPRPSYLDPEPDPYTVADTNEEPERITAREQVKLEAAQVEREIQLRTRTPPNPPPALPLFSGVYSFPVYQGSQKAWVWLAISGLVTFGLVRMLALFWPFGSG